MKYACCEFNNDGTVFPVSYNHTEADAQRARNWMKVGCGQFQDWRVIPMFELRELLVAGKVDLSCFTPAAQAEKRAEIMASAEAAP